MKDILENKLIWSASAGMWAFITFTALSTNRPSFFLAVMSAVATTILVGFFARIALEILDSVSTESDSQQVQVLEKSVPDYKRKHPSN